MKLFKKTKAKDDVLFEDLILSDKEITGILRFYVALSEGDYDKLRAAPDLLNEISALIHEKMQIEVGHLACSFNTMEPPIKKGGAIYASYRRDDEHDERLRRNLQKYFSRNVDKNYFSRSAEEQ